VARRVGVAIHRVVVQGDEAVEGAFTARVTERAGAVLVQPILATPRTAARAVPHHLPALALRWAFAEVGGLMASAASRASYWRRIATSVGKLLKGAKPADRPVEQPAQFELVLNLKTAQALGITLPPSSCSKPPR
jgi:putative ABC transport system substrate-binding protein